MDLTILKNTLGTDRQCREYLANIRWKNGFICPYCQNNSAWQTKDIKFKCKKCGHKISVTSGTVFQGSHIPLDKWFLAIWLIAEYGKNATADMLQKELRLGSNRTALNILKKLKKAINTTKVERLEHTVEINQRLINFNGQKFYVLIAAEVMGNAIGQIRIQKTDNNKAQIMQFVENNVVPYDLVESDLSPEQKKKKVGIVTQLLSQEDMGNDYNKLIKNPSYEYRFTDKVFIKFNSWIWDKHLKDNFEQACKQYCMLHNRKFVSVSFEELLANLLNL